MITKGRLLALLRGSQKIRQADAAKELGITASYLSLIEGGHREPSNGLLKQMADLYGIPMVLLFWNESDLERTESPEEKELVGKIDGCINMLFAAVMSRDEE